MQEQNRLGYELAEGDEGRPLTEHESEQRHGDFLAAPVDDEPPLSLSEARDLLRECREADDYFGRDASAATKRAAKLYDRALTELIMRDEANDIPDCAEPETQIEPRRGPSPAALALRARFAKE
jgi:hypothetical protein